jgi:hypothetical protein
MRPSAALRQPARIATINIERSQASLRELPANPLVAGHSGVTGGDGLLFQDLRVYVRYGLQRFMSAGQRSFRSKVMLRIADRIAANGNLVLAKFLLDHADEFATTVTGTEDRVHTVIWMITTVMTVGDRF